VPESNTRMNQVLRSFAQRRVVGHRPADEQPDGEQQTPAPIDAGPGRPVPPPPQSVNMNEIIRDAARAQRRPNQ